MGETIMKTLAVVLATVGAVLVGGSKGATAAPPAGCVEPADPSVWLVKTGGFWRAGGRFGHYRVIVRREGVEHASDRAELQIVLTNDKAAKQEISTCTDMKTPGLKGYVEDVTFKKVDDKVTAISLDLSMKSMNDVVVREIVLASYRGKVKRVVEASSLDLPGLAEQLASQ
jgi:hypothetical protein